MIKKCFACGFETDPRLDDLEGKFCPNDGFFLLPPEVASQMRDATIRNCTALELGLKAGFDFSVLARGIQFGHDALVAVVLTANDQHKATKEDLARPGTLVGYRN